VATAERDRDEAGQQRQGARRGVRIEFRGRYHTPSAWNGAVQRQGPVLDVEGKRVAVVARAERAARIRSTYDHTRCARDSRLVKARTHRIRRSLLVRINPVTRPPTYGRRM
jgi:hypothetical protein